jgi:tRNA dimethylallyltransferase
MDIGTGKITQKEMGKIPHHMLNILEPDEEYSVGRFKKDTLKILKKIWEK